MEWGPGTNPNTIIRPWFLSSGPPPGKPSKIIMFQACPQATKSHQNWSQSHRKPCKNDTKIDIIPTCVKNCFLQYLLYQMHDSGTPDIRIQTPKSLKNVTCKHACQKTQLLCQSWPKTSKWRPRNSSKIDRNPSLDPQGLLPCAPKSPCIARWSPRCQIGRNKHARWHVLGTKFGRIRAHVHHEFTNTWRRNCIQTSASQHTFQQRYFKKHPTNYKLKVKGPAAWAKP